MDVSSNISITITGKTTDGELNPRDIDINETRELINDVEMLLFPTRPEKEDRPRVSYEVKEGSVKNYFYLPIAKVIMFTALMKEVNNRGSLEILEPKAANIIDKWQRKAFSTGRNYSISSSITSGESVLTISKESDLIVEQSQWVNTSLYLYGKIYEEGGLNKVNLHIITDRFGKLAVKASEEQLTSGENKLFKVYGLWVKGQQSISTGELKNLELIDYLIYHPEYDEIALQKQIKKATINWTKIKDKDIWLNELRGGTIE